MKVILLQDVKALGKKGQVVKVNDGYARNFILPKKLGVEATSKNLNDLKLRKANEEKVAQENLDAAKAFAEELSTKEIILTLKEIRGSKSRTQDQDRGRWKNIRFCILQGNLRGSKKTAESGYR